MSESADREGVVAARTIPWITGLCIAASTLICLGLIASGDLYSWESYARFGYRPAEDVWAGAHWALVTSAFVHLGPIHLVMNVFWLWVLGIPMERAIGSARFLGFFVAAALVSSSLQLSLSDDTGVGASGVLYAIAAFMWVTRRRYPSFQGVLTGKTARYLIAWLFICVAVSAMDVIAIGNVAHFSGAVFGLLVGAAVLGVRPGLVRAALAVTVLLTVVPLFWAPWSTRWLTVRAYAVHEKGDAGLAIRYYDRILERDPTFAWARFNRGLALLAVGRQEEATADIERAYELDPQFVMPEGLDAAGNPLNE